MKAFYLDYLRQPYKLTHIYIKLNEEIIIQYKLYCTNYSRNYFSQLCAQLELYCTSFIFNLELTRFTSIFGNLLSNIIYS